MMLMRGTKKHTRQQLRDAFDKLKARVGMDGGATGASVVIEAPRKNLPEVMKLVAEVLREPAFDAKEFALLKEERLAGLEAQRSEPNTQGRIAFSRALSPYPAGHPYYAETLDESLAGVKDTTLEQAQAFYREFYGASQGELAAVGDFDAEALKKQVAELFGGWKSPAPYERIVSQPYKPGAQALSLETPDKANAFFLAGQGLSLRDDNADYPALVLGNFMMGGGFLNSRLATRVRQQEGLSYSVSSSLNAGSLDPVGSFSSYAIYAPQNAGKLEKAMREELEKALQKGFTPEELEKARAGLLEYRRTGRANDGGLASTLASYLYIGRTLDFDAAFEKRMSELKPEDVRTALARHLDWKKVTVVKAGDFAGAEKKAKAPVVTPPAP
jgi:zinc protease